MRLSITQLKVIKKMKPGEWASAYDLRCRISTLDALVDKGIVTRKSGLGAMFCPRTSIQYKLIKNIENIVCEF